MSALVSALILSVSQISINNLLTDFVTSLEESAPNTKINNQYFSYENSRMSDNLGILMKNIKIYYFQIPEHSVSMSSNREINISMKNVSLSFSFSWEYSINSLSDYGEATVSVKDGSMNTVIAVKDKTLLSFYSKKTELDLYGLQILVSRPDGVNQNWLFQMFRKEIEDVISQLASDLVENTINDYSLGDMYYKLDNADIGFDYSLTESPFISDTMLELKSKGIFVQDSQRNYDPPIPVPSSFESKLTNGMQFVASDYVANSLSYSAFMAGMLDLNLTNQTFAGTFPFELTTTVIGIFIPDLIDNYGLDEPVSLNFAFYQAPLIHFIENLQWSVQMQSSELSRMDLLVNNEIALAIEAMFEFEAQLYLEDWKVKGEILKLEFSNVKVISSQIDVNSDDIQSSVNSVLETYRNSLNNDVLLNGISLGENQRFDLTSTKIRSGDGFVLVYLEPRLNFVFDQLFE